MVNTKCFKRDIIKEESITKVMFNLLRDNMINIIPETFGEYDKDYKIFLENCIKNAAEEDKAKVIVAFKGEEVVGYIQYFHDIKANELWIREIQVAKQYQGDHETFPKLIKSMVVDDEYVSVNKIKGYINNNNEKSKKAFSAIGFKVAYEKNKGKIYNGEKEVINEWLNKKTSEIG